MEYGRDTPSGIILNSLCSLSVLVNVGQLEKLGGLNIVVKDNVLNLIVCKHYTYIYKCQLSYYIMYSVQRSTHKQHWNCNVFTVTDIINVLYILLMFNMVFNKLLSLTVIMKTIVHLINNKSPIRKSSFITEFYLVYF